MRTQGRAARRECGLKTEKPEIDNDVPPPRPAALAVVVGIVPGGLLGEQILLQQAIWYSYGGNGEASAAGRSATATTEERRQRSGAQV